MRWGITQFVLGTDRKMMGDSEPCDRTDVVVDSYPAPDAIRLELERILRSEYFINAERLSRFLRFIVEQTLAGRAADLKGSILAIEVFDRQTTFDSRFDSIVRVEAQRLRKKLEQFYKAEGVQSPVRIELLKGSYIPIFHGINSPERQAQADPAPTPAPPPQKRTTYSRSRLASLAIVVIATMAAILWGALMRKAPPVVSTVRVTSDTGLTHQPAFSPASGLVAYASDRAGDSGFDIWVQPFQGSNAVRLTADAGNEAYPAFSPDGDTIAYHSDRDGGGLYLVPALGGVSTLLAKGGLHPRFSPAGRLIAFWAGEKSYYSARLYVVEAAGGQPTRIVPEFQYAAYPIWSSDGDKVLFVGEPRAGDAWDWWIAPVNGGAAPVRTGFRSVCARLGIEAPESTWGTPRVVPGAWTPDGYVVFAAAVEDRTNIWRVHLSPEGGKVSGELERLTFGAGREDHVHPVATAAWHSRLFPAKRISGVCPSMLTRAGRLVRQYD